MRHLLFSAMDRTGRALLVAGEWLVSQSAGRVPLNAEEKALARQPKAPQDCRGYIQAIKQYRLRTGSGLKDAKTAVDAYRDSIEAH